MWSRIEHTACGVGLVAVACLWACGRLGYETLPLDGGADAASPSDGMLDSAWVQDTSADAPDDVSMTDGVTLVDGAADAPIPEPLDYCAQIPYLREAAVIDGKVDDKLPMRHWQTVAWTAATPVPGDVTATYALAWRPDGLYAFIDVADPDRSALTPPEAIYCDDSVELYVDNDGQFGVVGKYDPMGTRQFIIGAPGNDTEARFEGNVYEGTKDLGAFGSKKFIATPTPGGYAVEVFIEAADLNLPTWQLAAGQTVGVDLAHNVSKPTPVADVCGSRLGQYFLRALETALPNDGHPYQNTRAFCLAQLQVP